MTPDRLREIFDYDPNTGILYRKKRVTNSPAGPAGTTTGTGHMRVMAEGETMMVHRVAYTLMTGEWPNGEIDHIDGDPGNNRWQNLRAVSRAENLRNKSLPSNNTSGVCGVSYNKTRNKWRARISVNGDYKFLGAFSSFAEAVNARLSAEKKYGFHPNHGRLKQ